VHDLRNPLAAIYAGAEMLVDGNLPEEQTRRLARNIYRASRGIQDMLQQLLDVSRGRSGGGEMCSLSEVIAAAWASLLPGSDTRGIELITDVPAGLECPMERARMERVFSNLFENAIEAMRSVGRISVSSAIEGESVVVRVDDTGPGISPALRLGLGLALSRQTLLDHGGDMWADADGPGGRFRLRLPMEKSETPHEPSTAPPESNPVASLNAGNA
jgi:signal transduction histidine kinase